MADFEVRKDNQKQWYWTFQANNNKTIARSSESYIHRSDCLDSIKMVKTLGPTCTIYDMTTDPIHKVES